MNSRRHPTTTFLDLCAAGTPLAAVASCLLDGSTSSRDVLHLAQAVGKQYRQRVLSQITQLPSLKLQLDGVPAHNVRAGARLLLQLDSVQHVSAARDDDRMHRLCDPEGLTLLRLLPPSTFRRLQLDALYPERDPVGVCRAVSALTMLKELKIGLCGQEDELDMESSNNMQVAAGYLACLTQLTHLDVRGFLLTAAGIQHLAGLRALRELDLGYDNDLCGASLAPLSALTNLTMLHVDQAYCDEDTLRHIGSCTGLRNLDVTAPVYELEPTVYRHLSSLSMLTELQLECNHKFTVESMGVAARMINLEVLHLSSVSGSELEESCLAPLSMLSRLHTLGFGCMELGPAAALHISKCRQLRSLYVNSNHIGPEGAQHLAALTRLQELAISGNAIGATGAAHIANSLTGLTKLDVSHNSLGGDGAAHIARMTQLRMLQILYNKLNGASMQLLINHLPHLTCSKYYSSLKEQASQQRVFTVFDMLDQRRRSIGW